MPLHPGQLLAETTIPPGSEQFKTLLEGPGVKIERIISHACSSPEGFWYDQPGDEWVLLVKGEATLEFDPGGRVSMKAGHYLFIPRHLRHRVADTSTGAVWLAVHLEPAQNRGAAGEPASHNGIH